MTKFGYTLLCEQAGPKQLVRDAQRAEDVGFDFAVMSDHFSPWLEAQGHSPYAWSVLGAVAQATARMDLMTFVTCPTRRYHPAIVAQKAATMDLLSDGRFTLGVGAGENLNEHVVGAWPHVNQRHDMLVEALEIIKPLLEGESVSYRGDYFDVPQARLYDAPASGVPVAVAASGPSSCDIAGTYGDALVAAEPEAELIRLFDEAGGTGKPRYGQIPVCYGPDEDQCRKIVRKQWRWATLSWPVMSNLPDTTAFEAASRTVREEDVAELVPCGPDLDRYVRAVRRYVDAGFSHIALVQVGGDQQDRFLDWSERELLAGLRAG